MKQKPKSFSERIVDMNPPESPQLHRRYECRILGHSLPLIQAELDRVPESARVIAVVAIGVNLFGILDLGPEKAWFPPNTRTAAELAEIMEGHK